MSRIRRLLTYLRALPAHFRPVATGVKVHAVNAAIFEYEGGLTWKRYADGVLDVYAPTGRRIATFEPKTWVLVEAGRV